MRAYSFFRLEDSPFGTRRDTQLGVFRATGEVTPLTRLTLEAHALLSFATPSLSAASLVTDRPRSLFLPLQSDWVDRPDALLAGSFDRLNLQIQAGNTRFIVGRQPITWGVSYFWPALDLFSPFSPERIDRDYKAGVDAVRAVIPLSSYSEIEIVGAALGSSTSRDGAAGILSRIHLGRVDVGLMAGRFHRDTVLGGFLTGDLAGSGLRAEISWTDSGDPQDRLRGRSRFVRSSLGLDRQLSTGITLSTEASFNGFGSSDARDYPSLFNADRILRGEINALGRAYAGAALSWQFHPLYILSNAVLVNANDPSLLWIPSLTRSTGNNSELLLGAQWGFGSGIRPDLRPGSEYGSVPLTLFAGFKGYF